MGIGAGARASILRLRSEDVGSVGNVLADSHANYPSFSYLFPDQAKRRKILHSLFTGVARDAQPFGEVWAAVEDGRMLGAAVWLPPGAFPWSARRKLRGSVFFLPVLMYAPRSLNDFMHLGERAEEVFPKEPHWYLEVLGVRPEVQGMGLGTRLLEPVLARADEDGLPCYLETAREENLRFYRRLGFELEGQVQLLAEGPPHWAMSRPPRGEDETLSQSAVSAEEGGNGIGHQTSSQTEEE